MEEVLNNVSEQTNVADNSSNYIEAIKEMKANTVDKQAYLKLKEEILHQKSLNIAKRNKRQSGYSRPFNEKRYNKKANRDKR